jgi:hypothetical protein
MPWELFAWRGQFAKTNVFSFEDRKTANEVGRTKPGAMNPDTRSKIP